MPLKKKTKKVARAASSDADAIDDEANRSPSDLDETISTSDLIKRGHALNIVELGQAVVKLCKANHSVKISVGLCARLSFLVCVHLLLHYSEVQATSTAKCPHT